MADSYTNLLYHLVFSTKDRRPLITPDYETQLYEYIGSIKPGGVSPRIKAINNNMSPRSGR